MPFATDHPEAYATDRGGEKLIYQQLISVVEKAGTPSVSKHQEKLTLWKQKLRQLEHPVP